MTRPLYSLCPLCSGTGLMPGRGPCPGGCDARHVVESGLSEAQADVLIKRRQEAEREASDLRAHVRELEAEVLRLRDQVRGHCDWIAAQSDLLSRRAEAHQ